MDAVNSLPKPLSPSDIRSFLGLVSFYKRKGIEVDPKKTDAVNNWPKSLCPSDIRSFLGLVSFYKSVAHLEEVKKELVRVVHRLARIGVRLVDSNKGGVMVHNGLESSFVSEVKAKQGLDPTFVELRELVLKKFVEAFSQGGLGARVKLSRAFHPQTNGQAKCTIQTLEDMMRACVIDFKGNWDDHLHLIEFAYNNSYHSSICMAPFEVLYGRRCRSPIGWFEVGEVALVGPELVHEAMEKVWLIRERSKTTQSRQKSNGDARRGDLEFDVNDWVYLKISSIKGVMRFGKKGKLSPYYMVPYKILRCISRVANELELPND
ncbi:hypothetical protein MTR67_018878 [Solanum verrucosum]|uniref:Tf2-1-like SH3-like domain-containing protein n=1 Tax=Solanum verrucosum TaxID=315347 RepID=A0AAF0TU64_SOLVR|nr:hypothetical protein MTR67_018878 [Solanum verrucosum]